MKLCAGLKKETDTQKALIETDCDLQEQKGQLTDCIAPPGRTPYSC